ncbi:MAG: gluconate 2-dehydrogenase subunit 3 family protein [Gemmatimonadaceae bacterium]
MNRREALKTTTLLVGGVWVTSTGLLGACAPDSRQTASSRVLNPDDESLMEMMADTILPTTASSPGAKAAGVGPVINLLLTDCHKTDEQQRLVEGLKDFRRKCEDRCGGSFASLPQAKREEFLREIDAEAKKEGDKHYFVLARRLALDSYFTSRVGLTKALRYVLTPGRWVGCMPLQPGQPAWG